MKKYLVILFFFLPLCAMKEDSSTIAKEQTPRELFDSLKILPIDILRIIFQEVCVFDSVLLKLYTKRIAKKVDFASQLVDEYIREDQKPFVRESFKKTTGDKARAVYVLKPYAPDEKPSQQYTLESSTFYLPYHKFSYHFPLRSHNIKAEKKDEKFVHPMQLVDVVSSSDYKKDGTGVFQSSDGIGLSKFCLDNRTMAIKDSCNLKNSEWSVGNLRALLLTKNSDYCVGQTLKGNVLLAKIEKPIGSLKMSDIGKCMIGDDGDSMIGMTFNNLFLVTLSNKPIPWDKKNSMMRMKVVAWPLLIEKNKLNPEQLRFMIASFGFFREKIAGENKIGCLKLITQLFLKCFQRKKDPEALFDLSVDEKMSVFKGMPQGCIDFLSHFGALKQ